MNLKATVKKKVIPPFKAIGLELRDSSPSLFRFQNVDHSIMVKLHASNYPLHSKLSSLFHNSTREISPLPSTLHIEYTVFVDNSVYRIFPHQIINPSSTPYSHQIVYTNERELDVALLDFVEQTYAVLPILESLTAQSVFVSAELYSRLAQNTQRRASRFLMTHNLPNTASEASRTFLDSYLSDLLLQHSNNRKHYFLSHVEDFIDAAAYLGEIVSVKCNGHWDWYQNDISLIPYLLKLPESDKYESLDYMFDPLCTIIESWNTVGICKQHFLMDNDLAPLFA